MQPRVIGCKDIGLWRNGEGKERIMENTKRIAFYTVGCKLNFSETATISRTLSDKGFKRVGFDEPADVYVINTCSVTEEADKEFKQLVRKALRKNSNAFVAAIGCYAQLKPDELAAVEGVDLVLGATEKFKITHYLHDITKKEQAEVHSCEIEEATFYNGSYSTTDRTRAFLKVQDGCGYSCTYCTIPLARGISRSDTLQNILENARTIFRQGIKEIVLTGVNIGDYGKEEAGHKKNRHTFLQLIQALDEVEEAARFRISSIEPNLLRDGIITFVANSRAFSPHFHIPLQSGSNSILKRMKRRYVRELYADRVAKIRATMPHACIGADVIVGFPGETDAHFWETYQFLQELEVSYLHVFTYSEREHTEAALMDGVVPKEVRARRSKLLRGLSAKKRHAFYQSQIGLTGTVLFESENKKGYLYGFTENYVRVKTPWNPALANTLHKVRFAEMDEDGAMRFSFIEMPNP